MDFVVYREGEQARVMTRNRTAQIGTYKHRSSDDIIALFGQSDRRSSDSRVCVSEPLALILLIISTEMLGFDKEITRTIVAIGSWYANFGFLC